MDKIGNNIGATGGADPSRAGRSTPSVNGSLLKLVEQRCFAHDPEYQNGMRMSPSDISDGLPYHLFLPAEMVQSPEDVFSRLRWGGRAVMVSAKATVISKLAQRFNGWEGFILEQQPTCIQQGLWGIPLPGVGRCAHYLVVRKVDLMNPGETTDRFTYYTRLGPGDAATERYVVIKRVPTLDRVVARLRHKFPDLPLDDVQRRAQKFTDKIFPVLLTREAAMLDLLQRDLPEPFRGRVPHCLKVEKDSRGLVHSLYMNWLRNGGREISQLDFAIESAEMLTVLHDKAGVIHLDLRLDNFVVTEQGVGFIDFGSAVRDHETFAESSLLAALFQEMMRTCQVQRTLERMCQAGQVTNEVMRRALHRVNKAVDLFHLTLLLNKPTAHPDFKGLVRCDPAGEEARRIRQLTEEVLRPADAAHPAYRSALDLRDGLYRLREELAAARPAATPADPDDYLPHTPNHSADTTVVAMNI